MKITEVGVTVALCKVHTGQIRMKEVARIVDRSNPSALTAMAVSVSAEGQSV